MNQITNRVYQLGSTWGSGVFGANVYLLIGDSLTLVDAGLKGQAKHVIKEVERLGYSRFDVDTIIVTHHHVDHVGGLDALKTATKAKVVAHAEDAPFIDGRLAQPGPVSSSLPGKIYSVLSRLWTAQLVKVDVQVNDGDVLPVLGGIRVIHAPGHTPGSICLYVEQESMVIVGDVLNNRFGLGMPPKMFSVDMAQAVSSIEKVASLDFGVICFGHGTPIVYNAQEVVQQFAEKSKSKYQKS
jgi:glyoxylase-like metal-dependent hydrolase (beta-lactamase superfamily II)